MSRPGRPGRPGVGTPGRRGAVLPAVVLLLLAGTLLGHAGWLMATHQERVSRVGVALLRASLAAEAGLLAAERAAPPTAPGASARGEGNWGGEGTFQWRWTRVSREVVVVSSTGTVERWPPSVRWGRVLWQLDPVERVFGVEAVVAEGAPGPAALIEVADWWDAAASGCEALAAAGVPRPPRARGPTPGVGLGLLEGPELAVGALQVTGATVSPSPGPATEPCDRANASNWGAPQTPAHPCAGRFVHRHAPGSLLVAEGVGQGVLVVGEDLRLGPGAYFAGVVIAGGRITLESGARIEGMVIAGGGLATLPGARVTGSACAAHTALVEAPGLRVPRRLDGREWIPLS